MSKNYTTNKYSITIVKCCASCAHNIGASSMETRICDKGEGVVPHNYLCKMWEMRKSLDKAGRGDGRIKKHEYISWVKRKIDELSRTNLSPKEKAEIIDTFPSEWTKKHGSRYMK